MWLLAGFAIEISVAVAVLSKAGRGEGRDDAPFAQGEPKETLLNDDYVYPRACDRADRRTGTLKARA
jgi:hypothetical protein